MAPWALALGLALLTGSGRQLVTPLLVAFLSKTGNFNVLDLGHKLLLLSKVTNQFKDSADE